MQSAQLAVPPIRPNDTSLQRADGTTSVQRCANNTATLRVRGYVFISLLRLPTSQGPRQPRESVRKQSANKPGCTSNPSDPPRTWYIGGMKVYVQYPQSPVQPKTPQTKPNVKRKRKRGPAQILGTKDSKARASGREDDECVVWRLSKCKSFPVLPSRPFPNSLNPSFPA